MQVTKLCFLLTFLTTFTTQYYSKMYRKCQLGGKGRDIGSLQTQRILRYEPGFQFEEGGNSTKQVEYTDIQFLYIDFVGAGGSGQAYLVEDESSNKLKIIKRFFKQKPVAFAQENFIMHQMDYQVSWHYQDNVRGMPTLSAYQYQDSVTLRDLELETADERALIFYKICKELEKAHRNGIIHNDIKMANMLVSSTDPNMKLVNVQLIDWNLASFYYPGYESSSKRGTQCYYSPQLLLRTAYLTPATDIWSLGVVYFSYITNYKPFTVSCKDNGIEAVASLVGVKAFLEMYEKYRIFFSMSYAQIQELRNKSEIYKGISITDRVPEEYRKLFDNNLIDLFEKMLVVDPEYRITITQILHHPYFDRIKRLPAMYVEKKKSKQSKVQADQLHAPANNLVNAKPNYMGDDQL